MAQELLNASQVSSPLQEVGRRAVTQAVGAQVRSTWHAGKATMDQGTHRPGVDPAATHSQ